MLKAIITAANSFIGRKLCGQLDARGYSIHAIVRTSFKNDLIFKDMKNVKIVKCDMEDYKKLSNMIHENCDIGIALAWNGTRGNARNDRQKQEINYHSSVDCINSFLSLGCSTILTAGSQAEYGPLFGRRKVFETDICNPNTEYGKSKLKLYTDATKICRDNARLIEPRFFSLYGSDDFAETMIISMIRNMLQDMPCNLTKCIQLWDFLYIDDAIDALIRLIESTTAEGIYNLGSGISRPLKEYVEIMYTLTNSQSILNYGAVAYPPTGMVHTNPSIQRLTNELDWEPQISFEEGIKRVIKYQGELMNEKNKHSSSLL